MAKKKSAAGRVNKSKAIRDYLERYPKLMPKEMAEGLTAKYKKQGIAFSAHDVSQVKSMTKRRRRRRRRVAAAAAAPAGGVQLDQIKSAAALIRTCGDVAQAQAMLRAAGEVAKEFG
jgi:hypothetical protein